MRSNGPLAVLARVLANASLRRILVAYLAFNVTTANSAVGMAEGVSVLVGQLIAAAVLTGASVSVVFVTYRAAQEVVAGQGM